MKSCRNPRTDRSKTATLLTGTFSRSGALALARSCRNSSIKRLVAEPAISPFRFQRKCRMGLNKTRHGCLCLCKLSASTLQRSLDEKAICIAGRSDKTFADDRGRLFAAAIGIKRLTMHVGIVFRCHRVQSARPLRIGDSVRIVSEPDLRFGERHHAVGIVGVKFDRALRCLQVRRNSQAWSASPKLITWYPNPRLGSSRTACRASLRPKSNSGAAA